MTSIVRRRRFVLALTTGIACQLAGAPVGAALDRPVRLGFLCGGSCPSMPNSVGLRQLSASLREVGLLEGRHIVWDFASVTNDPGQLPRAAQDLVSRRPEIIVAWLGLVSARAARDATRTIPIVMMGAPDAVENGLVESLGRPSGNVTGVSVPSVELVLKQIQILKEIEPRLERSALVTSPTEASRSVVRRVVAAAPGLGIDVQDVEVSDPSQLDRKLAALDKRKSLGLVVVDDTMLAYTHRAKLLSVSLGSKIPLVAGDRSWIHSGGLFSYGPHVSEVSQRAASFIHRIVRGARPSDLPVEQPTQFEFILNGTTAKLLGLSVPVAVRTRADEIVD